MTSLLAVLLVIAIAIIVAMVIVTTNKNDLLRDWRRQISQLRDERSDAISRWRKRLEQITELTTENRRFSRENKQFHDEISRLAPFEGKVYSLEQSNMELKRKLINAEADARSARDMTQRGFNEFQELLTVTRAIVPAKLIEKGQEEGQSIKDIVRAYLQQVAERKSARRG
jgi:hypothetical protein